MEIRKPIANDDAAPPMDDGNAPPDHVQPFMLEASQLRGRIVRLPDVINKIIKAHDYPAPIASILGEALCLTTLLAGMLKFDGVFTFQAKGHGVLKTLVCDMTNDGILRGYAGYDKDALAKLDNPDFMSLMQEGYLAFTVDQADSTDRYQGIVPLEGDTLADCVRNYFTQSEQIPTAFVAHVGQDDDGSWSGGAIMLQRLPIDGGSGYAASEEDKTDAWQRSMVLMQTITRTEMIKTTVPLNTLLYRLFHEEGVRIFYPITITKGCRCSIDKISAVLDNLPDGDKQDLAENGVISVTCEFCNTLYEFPA